MALSIVKIDYESQEAVSYLFIARLCAGFHLAFAVFIFVGWLALLGGALARAEYARNRPFRIAHLAGLLGVLFFALAGRPCPLTMLEFGLLRAAEIHPAAEEPFLVRAISSMLYPDISPGFLFLATFAIGISTIALWWVYPPRPKG